MNVLFVVTHPESGPYLKGFGDACIRNGIDFAVFFSGDGVKTLENSGLSDTLRKAREAIVCEFSWSQKMGGHDCPAAMGSQTDHSRMLGLAKKVISL